MIICKNCNSEIKDGAQFCTVCGTKVEEEQEKNRTQCKFCGKEIDAPADFCVHCGKQLKEPKRTAEVEININNKEKQNLDNENSFWQEHIKTEYKKKKTIFIVTIIILVLMVIGLSFFSIHYFKMMQSYRNNYFAERMWEQQYGSTNWKGTTSEIASVTKVYYTNSNNENIYDSKLLSNEIRYLCFDFNFNLTKIPIKINIIELNTGNDLCEGRYTFTNEELTMNGCGWGSSEKSIYSPGWYLIQVQIQNGYVIGQQYVYIW